MWPLLELSRNGHQLVPGSYTTAMLAATLVALLTGTWQAAKHGLSRSRVVVCLTAGAVAAMPGARLWHAITHISVYQQNPAAMFAWQPAGFSLAGGILLAAAVVFVAGRRLQLPLRRLADAAAPGLLLAVAILRLGCFAQGCCSGMVTDLPWGVRYPAGSLPALRQLQSAPWSVLTGPQPVHPVQLYEAFGLLLAASSLLLYHSSQRGRRATWGLLWLAVIHGLGLLLRDPGADSLTAARVGISLDLFVALLCIMMLAMSPTCGPLSIASLHRPSRNQVSPAAEMTEYHRY